MAYDIGPKIGIDGEAEFRKQIRDVSEQIKTLGSEMGAVTAQYARNADSQEGLRKKAQILTEQISKQKEMLRQQQDMLAKATQEFGPADEKTQKWARTVNESTANLARMENALAETNEQLRNTGTNFGEVGERLKDGLVLAAEAGAAALAAASAAIVALTKEALESYAEYEQLVGGVETLFKESNQTVLEYAQDAFRTAGLSANEYMDTVTSFSASLLQSLNGDTQKAAEAADQAIIDMSDNANKMGTSMESIQNAYQGFAKQNYTMLDNLKLGYGGTKEEMERLLADAEKLTGQKYDLSSFADIVEAIHAIQTEMGITGTTAEEATTTIQGSASAMKAAWQNMMTGLAADDMNLDTQISNLVNSVVTFSQNLIPRIEQILIGIGQMVTQLAPVIIQELPAMIAQVLPSFLDAAVQMLSSFGTALIKSAPVLRDYALELLTDLAGYFRENLPAMIETGLEVVSGFANSLRENAGLLIDAALDLAMSLAQGLADAIPAIIENVPEIVSNIANTINDNAPKILETGVGIIGALLQGLLDSIPALVENIPQIINAIINVFSAFSWLDLGKNIMDFVGQGIKSMTASMTNYAKQIVPAVKNGLSSLPSEMLNIGKNIVNGIWNGIKNSITWLKNQIKGFAAGIVNSIQEFLGIHSPSKVMQDQVGKYMAQGVGVGFVEEMGAVQRRINSSMDALASNMIFEPAGAPAPAMPSAAGYSEIPPAGLADAIREALNGAAVYMDGQKVGDLVTTRQRNAVRARGGSMALA